LQRLSSRTLGGPGGRAGLPRSPGGRGRTARAVLEAGAGLQGRPGGMDRAADGVLDPRPVDQHIGLGAAAVVCTNGVVLVEIYLARIHHLPARTTSHTVCQID